MSKKKSADEIFDELEHDLPEDLTNVSYDGNRLVDWSMKTRFSDDINDYDGE